MTIRGTLRDHRGITLLDLLVAFSLLAIGAGGIFAGFKGSLKAWTIAQQYAGEQHNARIVLDWVSRRVRMAGNGYVPMGGNAYAFWRATSTEVVFLGNTDEDPSIECYRIFLNATPPLELNVVYAAENEGSGCVSPTPITFQTGQALSAYEEVQRLTVTSLRLEYFTASGGVISVPVTGSDLATIRRVRITIQASGVQFLGPFTLSTEVTIR